MAIGGYGTAYLIKAHNVTFVLAVLASCVIALLGGALVGYVALRLRGNYLAMATLAVGSAIYALFMLPSRFGGASGYIGIPLASVAGHKFLSARDQYLLVAVPLVIVLIGARLLLASRAGSELAAIRDDEVAAGSVGINVTARKVQVFAITSAIGALAGALNAPIQTAIDPSSYSPDVSLQLFVMVVLGGLGSIYGAVLGAAMVTWLISVTPSNGTTALTVLGVVVVVFMAVAPDGISGIPRRIASLTRWNSLTRPNQGQPSAQRGGEVSLARVRRGFVDVAEGQVHYRECGHVTGAPVLVMLHASPGSAKMLEPLMAALAHGRRVVAFDTLGNGDSSAPAIDEPAIEYFADGHLRSLDALGIAAFDQYGTHTGANIAVELTLRQPERVRSLILDGMSLYSADQRADMLRNYASPVEIDLNGSQLNYIWHFVRDAFLFWPWYRRDAEHLRAVGLPSAEALHEKVVEVLKATRTFHLPYNAAIAYDKVPRLPLLTTPTLLACSRDDMLMEYFEDLRGLMPSAEWLVTEGGTAPEVWAERITGFEAFLAG